MAGKTKSDLEVDFCNCCAQIAKENGKELPDNNRLDKLKRKKTRIAKGTNILRESSRKSKLSFSDVGRL